MVIKKIAFAELFAVFLKLFVALLVFSSIGASAQSYLTVSDVKITDLRVYESSNNDTKVWIFVNGSSRVGPNPSNSSYQCELWTATDAVYSAALSALMSGNSVEIEYRDRGEGTYWCDVRVFRVQSN